ncbi:REP-associated tyrosine transposase [Pseudomonas syringae]|uniref:Transposase n=1 Tax=Pseudomonas syringae TaxID=317 RepID=A0A085UMJ5_PSESX|nr:transposase [Pseudomonas syringae]KFE44408.1 transposase [Pseudomonas syringae]
MQNQEHGRRLRVGRFSMPGHIYLVTCVVKNRQPVFNDFHIGRRVVREMRCLHDSGVANSLAWVVMPDHLHWLFELRSGSLAALMQLLKGRSACRINKAFGSKTLEWQKGYYDHAVRAEKDLEGMARYVIANPVRAGLVTCEGEYPLWDSVWT